jgi:hypothetical protein
LESLGTGDEECGFGGGVDVRLYFAEVAAVAEQAGDQIFQCGWCLADRGGEVWVGEEAHEVGDVDEVAVASFLVEGQQFEQHAADDLAHGRGVVEGQAFAGTPFGVGVEDAQRAEQQLVSGAEVLLVLGAQGAIRLVVDHGDAGLLRWVPGSFWMRLVCYLVATVAGVGLATWGARRAKRAGSDP